MPSIRLDQAIQKIYRTVAPKRSGRPTPFFFIVGAGISYPPVPLASQIVEHCKAELAKENDPITPPATTNPIEVYSYWFDRAYPSRERVQKYLRDLMEKLPVSKANLRLAHLLLDGRVAHTVFTPNFDDMLTRALELFGKRPLICDHPFTALRMKIDSDDPQIIHVHGSYWFYDCCNLRHDIAARSANNDMSGTLDDYLRDHSPLVVGYSGWEGDIVMSALKRRLDGQPLGTPIYWFCYRKQALETLPGWLTEREDVFFVLPDDPVAAAASDSSLQAPGIQAQSSSDLRATSRGSLAEAKEPVLEARRVFDALAQRFDLEKPPLTKDPLGFFARQLRELLGAPDPGDTEQDTFYSFHTVIATVERAGKAEAAEAARTPDALQGLRDAMSKADYRAVIAQAGQIDLGRLSDPQRREALLVLWDASTGLFDNSQEEIAGYDLVVKAADFLDTVSRASEPIALRVAMALVNKGIVLGAFNRSEEAVAVYDELLRRFADAPEPALREQVANALFNKGIVLGALNRNEEAVAVYDELLRRFADAPESALREKVAKALVNKGFALGALNRSEGAVAVYDELLRRFADAPEPALREQVTKALVGKGFRLGALNRSEEAVAVYDELLRRFADAPEPALREQVAKALVNKGFVLGALNRSEEAVAVYGELLRRFTDAPEPALREQVANALFNKGVRLGALNRSEEAVAVYDELLRRFADAPEPALREQVANALFNKGIVLGALNRNEEAVAVYDELLRRFADAPESALREKVAKALVNKGFALGALNRSEGAVAVYDEVLRRFAEAPEPALREQVANALFNKGFRLGALNRSEEEVAIYDELLRRFTDAPEPALREQVAKALVGKGFRLGELNRSEEAVSVYDEVMHRFADALEPALREPVAMALVNKGVTYELLDRREAAISTYEELLSRFAGSPEPDLGALVSRTRSRLDELRGGGAPSPS